MNTSPATCDCPEASSSGSPPQRSPGGRTMYRQGKRQRITSDTILKNALRNADFRALCEMHQRGLYGPAFEHNLLEIDTTADPLTSTPLNADELPRSPNELTPQQFLLPEQLHETSRQDVSAERQETLMEWFDQSVEKELKKRRDNSDVGTASLSDGVLGSSPATLDRLAEASASRVEIVGQMLKAPDTELTDAVEKLAKAEAMCAFADAVRTAEAAAEAAPPGQAEEAAVASVKGRHTDVRTTSMVRETLPGVRPIEVVGYVGVTKPSYPLKS